MSKPKRHHVLPEFYLNGFAKEGRFFVFDRSSKEYRQQTPKNTAVEGHYYAFINTEGKIDYSIETMLSRFESEAKKVLEKFSSGEDISEGDRGWFAYFLAFLFSRVPRFEREINEIADKGAKLLAKAHFSTVDAIDQYFSETGDRDRSFSAEEFHRFIHEEEYSVVGNRNITVETMLDQAPRIAELLGTMNWTVVRADRDNGFVTSDSPFAFLLSRSQQTQGAVLGIGSPQVRKVVPLTRNMALVIGSHGFNLRYARANRDLVREVNLQIAYESERFLIAADERLLRSVVRRSRIDREDTRSVMKFEEIPDPANPNRSLVVLRRLRPGLTRVPIKVNEEASMAAITLPKRKNN